MNHIPCKLLAGTEHWKLDPFKQGDMQSHLLEESSFATLFPAYREKYLREVSGCPVVMEHRAAACTTLGIRCRSAAALAGLCARRVAVAVAVAAEPCVLLPPQVWPLVTKALKEYGVSCELNLVEGRATPPPPPPPTRVKLV
jgi:hypothetical protein